jgi:peptidylprolyl isomerase
MRILRPLIVVAALLAGAARAADAPPPAGPPPQAWRDVSPGNLVLLDTRYGQVVLELAPQFAPGHVARMRKLLHAHFYDGKSFYRVIDGFVAQGGADEDTSATPDAPVNPQILKDWPRLKAEFDRPLFDDPKFTPLGNPDSYAPEVGFVDGFPAGRDMNDKREWVLHCPGTFAFARDNDDDTATTEFYIVIGEAPRRLDRNLTAFGRVLSGMQYLQKLERGDPDVDSGVIQDPAVRDPIVHMQLAADMPAKDRPHWQVLRTDSAVFADMVEKRRHPAPEFYHRLPLANLDVCSVPVPVRLVQP